MAVNDDSLGCRRGRWSIPERLDRQRTEHREIDVAAADEAERHHAVEGASAQKCRDRPAARIGEPGSGAQKMPSRICPRCQAAVIGLTCLCLVSPHADAHTHEEYGPVQTVPFIPDLAYTAVLSGSSLLSTRPGWFTRAAEVGLADMSSHRCLTDVQVLALSPARWSCSKKPLPKKIVAPCLRLAR